LGVNAVTLTIDAQVDESFESNGLVIQAYVTKCEWLFNDLHASSFILTGTTMSYYIIMWRCILVILMNMSFIIIISSHLKTWTKNKVLVTLL
jgi:hypothetical protein